MPRQKRRLRVGLLWSQFSPYHVDRCEAVARHLADSADVVAIEVATTSTTYAWSPSGDVAGASKRTLFPGLSYDAIHWWPRFRRQFAALRACDTVYVGISYGEIDIILLGFCLRLAGVRVVLMTESKFDDQQRRVEKELFKAALLLPYKAAIVGGDRQASYVRFMGFRCRRVVTGYDTVGLDRVRRMGGGLAAPAGPPHGERGFVFVGRFVRKKCVPLLVEAYARYRALATAPPRPLLLIGSGEDEAEARALIARHGLDDLVRIAGFLQADGVAQALAAGLALILPSREEQWGLVVNEALAFNLPIVVTEAVGARDLLVRNLVNGFVVERGAVDGLAQAMLTLAEDEAAWQRMVAASASLAPAADTARFAEAVAKTLQ